MSSELTSARRMGSVSWMVPQPRHREPAVDAVSLGARARVPTAALLCAWLLPVCSFGINAVRKRTKSQPCFHLSSSLLLPLCSPARRWKPHPNRLYDNAGLSEPARAASRIPLYFNLGKCHCTLVLEGDISDPIKYVVISIVTAHAEPRELMVVNVTTWCLGE